MKKSKKYMIGTIVLLAILIAISLAVSIFAPVSFLESLRIVFGSIYVLFLPGFVISYIFFPKTHEFDSEKSKEKSENNSKSVDWIERIALSFALSIAIVPLVVFYLNIIKIKINLLNSFLTILGIILISIGILYWKKRKYQYV